MNAGFAVSLFCLPDHRTCVAWYEKAHARLSTWAFHHLLRLFKTVEWKFASLSYLNSLSVFSRSGFDRSSLIGSVFRHLDGDDGLFRILDVEHNAFRQHDVLGEDLGTVG